MGLNLNQVYTNNPAASIQDADILYLIRSPYAVTNDMGGLSSTFRTYFQTVVGVLNVNATTSSTLGVVNQGGARFIHTFGSLNTFVGSASGNFTLTGARNVGLGNTSLTSLTTGSDNFGCGYTALQFTTTGNTNVAVGSTSMQTNISGSSNTAIGHGSLNLSSTGSSNTAAGYLALTNLGTGSSNTALGQNAGSNYTGAESSNLLIGNAGTLGESNKCRIGVTGSGSGQQTDTYLAGIVHGNVFDFPTTASLTVGTITQNSLSFIHSFGTDSLFVGKSAGNFTMADALRNHGLGVRVLSALTSGDSNLAVGYEAGQNVTTGSFNTLLGMTAAENLSSGSSNVAVGVAALQDLLTGNYNIAIGGNGAGSGYTGAESSNICIEATGTAAESHVMRLGTFGSGDGQVNTTFIAGATTLTSIQNTPIGSVTPSTGAFTTINASTSITLAANADLIFNGGTGQNNITVPNNLADALTISDGVGNNFFQAISTTATPRTALTQTVSMGAGQIVSRTSVTAATYTALYNDYFLSCNRAGTIGITLIASPDTGRTYRIKDISGAAALNNITITPAAGNIDGAASYVINTNYGSVDVVYSGTEWSVL